jgi:succinate-acetate transporter protein
MTWMTQLGVFGEALKAAADILQLGVAYVGYIIFTLIMTYGAASTHKVLFSIFVMIDFLFIGLALNTLCDIEFGHTLAAFSELIIAILSFYGCGAAVLNTHFGKAVLPVGKALIKK